MSVSPIHLTAIETKALKNVLKWACEHPRMIELSQGEINYIKIINPIIEKISKSEE